MELVQYHFAIVGECIAAFFHKTVRLRNPVFSAVDYFSAGLNIIVAAVDFDKSGIGLYTVFVIEHCAVF